MKSLNPAQFPIFSTAEQGLMLAQSHPHIRTHLCVATVMGGMGAMAVINHIKTTHPQTTIWYDVGIHDGYALESFNLGMNHIIYTGDNPKIHALATQNGAIVITDEHPQ